MSHKIGPTKDKCIIQKETFKKGYGSLSEAYHFVKKVFKNETGVRDIPDLLVCTPPKAGTTNWSRVLWQLKYLNELGILVDKEDRNYINMKNLYSLWFGNYDSEKLE